MKLLSVLLFLTGFYSTSLAQFSFRKTDTLQVFVNSNKLKFPFAGGFNYMQFSAIDLNYDGVKDLFAFDRSSNKVSTFLNEGITDSISYLYAPEYSKYFPSGMKDWAILADYNCDGKADIFTQNQGCIKVYTNDGNTLSGLHFTLTSERIYSIYSSDSLPLYVSSVDIPTITDMDTDGDLDIVTFSANGYYIEYHKNLTKELFSNCDSLRFHRETACWANIKEDQSNCTIYMNQPCGNMQQLIDNDERNTNHSGSALLALDLDGDIDKDLLIADISCTGLTAITNSGTVTVADAINQENNFPSNDIPVNVSIFPTPFFLDVNNDDKKDLVISPNTSTGSENRNCALLYKNNGSTQSPQFNFIKNNFLVDEMIDNGEGAYPAFFDFNHDGLLDFVLGDVGRFINSETKGRLMLFRNIGTTHYPKYELYNDDYLNFSATTNQIYLKPTFGDLDGDGDVDLIIGNGDGKLLYYTNIAALGADANFQLQNANYASIDVGYCAAPQIIDVNRDGLLDLIIGYSIGKIKFYQNTGTAQNPQFTLVSNFFGNVFTGQNSGLVISDGYCVPQLFDIGGTYHLICGSKSGRIFKYENIDGNLNGNFSIADTNYLHIWEGFNSAPAFADINNDGQPDMLLGNICGGLNYYSGDITTGIKLHYEESKQFTISPNPITENFTISSFQNFSKIEVVDMFGNLTYTESFLKLNSKKFKIHQDSGGLYFIKLYFDSGYISKKVIFNKE